MTKLALLIGCNYEGSEAELRGCINDIHATKDVLLKHFQYEESNITLLTDHTADVPTKHNIVKYIMSLAERSYHDDVTEVWISYSGHGTYTRDTNGDEDDGRDECLVPLDYARQGNIDDDTLNSLLALFHPSVRLVFICDACHSGTILDLPYRYLTSKEATVLENVRCKVKCNAMMISGCRDRQTSADAYDVNDQDQYTGAMTSALLHVLKTYNYTIHVHLLLTEMRKFLRNKRFRQVPQVSSTSPIACHVLFSVQTPPTSYIQ